MQKQIINPLKKLIAITYYSSFVCCTMILAQSPAIAPAMAADKIIMQRGNIQLLHKPISEKFLPPPGENITLALEVGGSKELALPVRLVAVRDGRLLPVPLSKSYRNAAEHPVYEFDLASPLVELTYQFILPTSGSAVIATERVTVRRQCVPALDVNTAGNANSTELEKLAISAKVLEQEIDAYSSALALGGILQNEVAE